MTSARKETRVTEEADPSYSAGDSSRSPRSVAELAHLPFPWDEMSDQPHRVSGDLRQLLRKGTATDYLRSGLSTLLHLPRLLRAHRHHKFVSAPGTAAEMFGVAISPLDQDISRIGDLLDELGAQHILVRFEWRRMKQWPQLREAITQLNKPTLAVLVQDRPAVVDQDNWRSGLTNFYQELPSQIEGVQALQAINRLKWGCATVAEAAPLTKLAVEQHRQSAPELPILGSSIIDFEPLATWRSLTGLGDTRFDGVASLLYIDRRGGPQGKQYGYYDFLAKIRAIAAMAACSKHTENRLWLTEFNWPLEGTGRWAPTSQEEAVSPQQAADWAVEYLQAAQQSGLVERCYFWQLMARGYGLVDHIDFTKRPAFDRIAAYLREN